MKAGKMILAVIAAVIFSSCSLLKFPARPNSAKYSAIVNYDFSQPEMIAAGKYDWTNSDITAECFPVKGKGQANVNFIVKHFARSISTEAALKELDNEGLRPATIEELLAFGAKYPDEQRKCPVIALVSVSADSSGSRRVACLYGCDSWRGLGLSFIDNRWGDCCRFLAVGK
jgi:hypothetical protein